MIYTTGTIAISGNAVTGTGTNFSAPLSLIRVGCTLIAVSDPIQIFTITEIKSGTELSVTPAANPAIPAGTKFSILLSDSISVDGLAQDVAETLRYYQSQEAEIATAVEWWKDFGGDGQMDQLLADIRAETAQSAANAQKTETDKNAAAASATAAKKSQTEAKTSETNAAASATAAKTSETNSATSETNAAQSAANALNYRNQAQSIVGSDIGLGSSPRDCPDISGNPSGYIGFMRIREAATGFPSIASGEAYLTGFISGNDGSPSYTGVFQGWETRSLYTYRWAKDLGPQWTRHARKDEVNRLSQIGSDQTRVYAGNGTTYLEVGNNRAWGVYDAANSVWQALGIIQGGTGANDAATARTNLAVMHEQKSSLGDTDLDTLTAAYSGFYWQSASSKATTELHYPCNYGGALVVLKNGNYTNGATQLYYPCNSTGLYYMRTYYANHEAWTDWAKFESDPLVHEEAPFPDVWIPFNDSLDMLAGFAPGYKKVTVNGETTSIPSDKVVTFARASTATYINKSGVLTIADINEPRFEREGLLIEGTRTNYLRNSNNPTSWTIHSQLTKETGTDENGFNYATVTVTDNLVGTTGGYTVHGVVTTDRFALAAGESCTFSARCRGVNARCRARVSVIIDGTDTFSAESYLNLNTGEAAVSGDTTLITAKSEKCGDWYYFEVTYTAGVDADAINCCFYINNLVNDTFYSDSSLTMATPQIELGACASSFIVSGNAPTTRASDLVSIPTKNNLFKPPFSFLLEVHKDWSVAPNAAPCVYDIAAANTGQSVITAINRGSNKLYVSLSTSTGTYINSSASSIFDKDAVFGAVVKDDGNFHVIMDGVAVSDAYCEYGGVTPDKNIRIGGQTSTGERHLFGHVRNFRIWHKALTDGQLFEKV